MSENIMTLSQIGKAMKKESKKHKYYLKVSKGLWNELADLLIDTDRKLQDILDELQRMNGSEVSE